MNLKLTCQHCDESFALQLIHVFPDFGVASVHATGFDFCPFCGKKPRVEQKKSVLVKKTCGTCVEFHVPDFTHPITGKKSDVAVCMARHYGATERVYHDTPACGGYVEKKPTCGMCRHFSQNFDDPGCTRGTCRKDPTPEFHPVQCDVETGACQGYEPARKELP